MLAVLEVPHFLVQHIEWPAEVAGTEFELLPKFSAFAKRAIACSPSVCAVIGRYVSDVKYLPYPVPLPKSGAFSDATFSSRVIDVLWVGREADVKDPALALQVLKSCAEHGLNCAVYCSYVLETSWTQDLVSAGVSVFVGEPREDCERAMADTKVVLSTSKSEAFATVLVEGLLNGCHIVYPERLNVEHLIGLGGRIKAEDSPDIWAREIERLSNTFFTPMSHSYRNMIHARTVFAASNLAGHKWRKLLEDERRIKCVE
jgi:glycosyltransferase involved in cell wall biosynthesis